MKVAVCNVESSDFEQKLLDSVKNTGFVVLTHHGIDIGLIKESQAAWRQFFLREDMFKRLFVNGNNTNLGYKGIGAETAVGSKIADIKEFFHWKPGAELPHEVMNLTEFLFYKLETLGLDILKVLEKETNASYADDCSQSNNTLFRALYYPALKAHSKNATAGAVRAAAHEDINHITMLVAASAPGLQVQDLKGRWHDVPHEENSITVNIGDMLQLASDGLFKSTTHRVVNPSDTTSDRISMPLFIHPHSQVMLSPGMTAGKFLQERINEIYGKK